MIFADKATSWKKHAPDVIYFLRAGDFIKIGRTSGHPKSRISQIQTGCPFKVDFIGWIFGNSRREARLHSQFAHLRTYGEWFHADQYLLTCINTLLDSHGDRLEAEKAMLQEQQKLLRQLIEIQSAELQRLHDLKRELSDV